MYIALNFLFVSCQIFWTNRKFALHSLEKRLYEAFFSPSLSFFLSSHICSPTANSACWNRGRSGKNHRSYRYWPVAATAWFCFLAGSLSIAIHRRGSARRVALCGRHTARPCLSSFSLVRLDIERLEKAGRGKIKGTLSRKFATLMEVICGSSTFTCLSNTRHEILTIWWWFSWKARCSLFSFFFCFLFLRINYLYGNYIYVETDTRRFLVSVR